MRIAPAVLAVLLAIPAASCREATAPQPALSSRPALDLSGGKVVAHVSVGSNDLCPALGLQPGCAADFSLEADKYADGTVRGEWDDQDGVDSDGNLIGGVHVAIDCLVAEQYEIGTYSWPIAWVSGVVTQSTNPGLPVGESVITVALDRSHNTPSDRFQDLGSFTVPLSLLPDVNSCEDRPDLPVFLNTEFIGQVSVWYR